MAESQGQTNKLVTIFGGSGFVGRHLVRELAARGWRIRVATRRPDLANHLQPLGKVGQIMPIQANLRYPASVKAAVTGADAVINLVGILSPSGRQSFEAVHTFGARVVAKAAAEAGVANLVHMSALGADSASTSAYAASKGRGEDEVRAAFPRAVIVRPSVIFGPEDDLFNRFAGLARFLPILPLMGGGETKFQPVYVGDVALAIANALEGKASAGATYELGGPETKSLKDIFAYVCAVTGRKRLLAPVPWAVAGLMAFGTEMASKLSLGIFPAMLTTTRDQLKLLKSDNVVSEAAVKEGRDLKALGIATPESIEAVVPAYLYRYRKAGQFSPQTTG